MKTKNILLIAATGLLLSGCFIKSLFPFYTKKDVVYDSSIIGTWIDSDSSKWIINKQTKWSYPSDSSYQVDIIDNDGKKCTFNVHLFRLNNQLYLDFFPNGHIGSNSFVEENIVPTHSLAKISYTTKSIKVQWFNEIWFGQLLKQNRIRIKHEKLSDNDTEGDSESYLLTASTKELQKFIIKYGNDSLAFKSIWENDKKKRNEEAMTLNLRKISNATN
jgi:hypothetical protein